MSLFWLGAVLAAGLLGSGIALIVAGIAVDRLGARRAMLLGTVIATARARRRGLRAERRNALRCAPRVRPGIAVTPVAGAGALFVAYPAARRGWALGVRQTAVPLGGTIAAVTFPVLFALGGLELAMLGSAAAVAGTGVAFALVAGDDRRPASSRVGRPFRTILAAPGLRGCSRSRACYIVVLQALLTYIVPAVRAAGHSELTAAVAYFAINVAAMVARIAWGKIADRGGGTRRVRTLVEVGLVAAGGARRLRRRAARVRGRSWWLRPWSSGSVRSAGTRSST